jgi:hypothetical protein
MIKYFYKVNRFGDIRGFVKIKEEDIKNYNEAEAGYKLGLEEITREQYEWIMRYKPQYEVLDLYLDFSEPRCLHEEEREKVLKGFIDKYVFYYIEDENGGCIINPKDYDKYKKKYGSEICFKGTLKEISEWDKFNYTEENINLG